LTNRLRRLTFLWLCILLIPMSVVTVLLFTTTGRLVPRTFRSWDELGCTPYWRLALDQFFEDPTPRFVMSECGSYFAKMTPHPGKRDEGKVDVSFHEFSSGTRLCALEDRHQFLAFRVSRDRRFLSLKEGPVDLFDLKSGTPVQCPIDQNENVYSDLVFAPDSQSALLADRPKIKLIDLNSRATLRELRQSGPGDTKLFYDRAGRPKYYRFDEPELEQWDVLTENCDWRRKFPDSLVSELTSRDRTVFFTLDANDSLLNCWSISEGHCIAQLPIGDQSRDLFRLSADGRFMLYGYSEPHWLEPILQRLPSAALSSWSNRLERAFGWNVYDTHRGANYAGLPSAREYGGFDGQAQFVEFGSQLNTADNQGIYEWDLPPRWQYFTPWAWPALATWLSLIGIVWMLRQTRKSGTAQRPSSGVE
jgi:hypothetical protein